MKKNILVVSHDAGGANILFSLIKKYRKDFSWRACVSGPAKNVFSKYKNLVISPNPKEGWKTILTSLAPDLLLTGTSWGSTLEIDAIKAAKKINLRTASFLDHWVNYCSRFGDSKKWQKNLPDYIFVGDKKAYQIALKNGFSNKILKQVENPYFEEVIKQANKVRSKKNNKDNKRKIKILYLSQPVSRYDLIKQNDPNYLGGVECQIVKDLLTIINIQKAKKFGVLLKLRIRLHPAEKVNKYNHLIENKKNIRIKKSVFVSKPMSNSLIKDFSWADKVIGSDSMALFLAKLIGKEIISYNPCCKLRQSLPDKEIKRINTINKLAKQMMTFNNTKKDKKTFIQNNNNRYLFSREIKKIFNY